MQRIKGKTLSSKSQITIPKTIREIMELKEGDSLDFVIEDGVIYIEKSKPVHQCFACNNGTFFNNQCKVCKGTSEIEILTKESLITTLASITSSYNAPFNVKYDNEFVIVDVLTENAECNLYVQYIQLELIKLSLKHYKIKDLLDDNLINKILPMLKSEEMVDLFVSWRKRILIVNGLL